MTTNPQPPPTCCATVPTGTCGRPAHWTITGEGHDGTELCRFVSCAAGAHRTWCTMRAWEVYHVTIVKLRRLAG